MFCSPVLYYESQSLEILGVVFMYHISLLILIPVVYRENKSQEIQVQLLNIKAESQVSCASSESTDNMYFLEGTSCDSFPMIS